MASTKRKLKDELEWLTGSKRLRLRRDLRAAPSVVSLRKTTMLRVVSPIDGRRRIVVVRSPSYSGDDAPSFFFSALPMSVSRREFRKQQLGRRRVPGSPTPPPPPSPSISQSGPSSDEHTLEVPLLSDFEAPNHDPASQANDEIISEDVPLISEAPSHPPSQTVSSDSQNDCFGARCCFWIIVGINLVICASSAITVCFLDHKITDGDQRIVNAIYFLVTTFTTVGFGDVCPSKTIGKLLVCIFILSSQVLTNGILSDFFLSTVTYQQKAVLCIGCRTYDTCSRLSKIVSLFLLLFVYFGLGLIVMCFVERTSFIDSFYTCVTALTTVGYGGIHHSFKTVWGRVFASVWLFLGTTLTSHAFATIVV